MYCYGNYLLIFMFGASFKVEIVYLFIIMFVSVVGKYDIVIVNFG